MLKIWLKLVLKGRCARKSRPVLEGLFGATRPSSDDWSQFEAFQKNSLFYFFPLEPGSSVQADSGRLLLTPSGANLGPSQEFSFYIERRQSKVNEWVVLNESVMLCQ